MSSTARTGNAIWAEVWEPLQAHRAGERGTWAQPLRPWLSENSARPPPVPSMSQCCHEPASRDASFQARNEDSGDSRLLSVVWEPPSFQKLAEASVLSLSSRTGERPSCCRLCLTCVDGR